jgi:hypothetical protein
LTFFIALIDKNFSLSDAFTDDGYITSDANSNNIPIAKKSAKAF